VSGSLTPFAAYYSLIKSYICLQQRFGAPIVQTFKEERYTAGTCALSNRHEFLSASHKDKISNDRGMIAIPPVSRFSLLRRQSHRKLRRNYLLQQCVKQPNVSPLHPHVLNGTSSESHSRRYGPDELPWATYCWFSGRYGLHLVQNRPRSDSGNTERVSLDFTRKELKRDLASRT
jgi:hypothetical protein